MPIQVRVINEDSEVLQTIGQIIDNDLINATKEAQRNNLKCLSFVDFVGNTIFNAKQCREILQEIKILKAKSNIPEWILNMITIGAQEALSDVHLYLKFDGE